MGASDAEAARADCDTRMSDTRRLTRGTMLNPHLLHEIALNHHPSGHAGHRRESTDFRRRHLAYGLATDIENQVCLTNRVVDENGPQGLGIRRPRSKRADGILAPGPAVTVAE